MFNNYKYLHLNIFILSKEGVLTFQGDFINRRKPLSEQVEVRFRFFYPCKLNLANNNNNHNNYAIEVNITRNRLIISIFR